MELFTYKIYTKRGFEKENILEGKKALDVGCGKRKLSGSQGIDIDKKSDADVIHNLDYYPWPLEQNSFEVVLAQHVLEHLDNVGEAMKEIHRTSKNGARIIIQVPYFRSRDAFTDVSHKHFFAVNSDKFFANKSKFKKVGFWLGWPQKSKNPLKDLLKKLVHAYPDFYEKYLSVVFPVQCLTWEFEVIK